MVVVACPLPGCQYETANPEPAVVSALLQLHDREHQPRNVQPRGPKLKRPSVNTGINEESWNSFVRLWEAYKEGSCIAADFQSIHLLQCASDELADVLLKSDAKITSKPVDHVLRAMRVLAVIPVARGITRTELRQMKQKNDESFRLFAARVRGKAETCDFVIPVKCQCDQQLSADYTEDAIRDVLLAGISDSDIRREALSTEGLQRTGINNIVSFVEGREMASKAVFPQSKGVFSVSDQPSSVTALSSFKRRSEDTIPNSEEVDRTRAATCPGCGKRYALYKRNRNGWNRRPYKNCLECWRADSDGKSKPKRDGGKSPGITMGAVQISAFSALCAISHQVFTGGRWHNSNFRGHPILSVRVSTEDYAVSQTVQVIADTGAQSNLWGYKDFISAGFDRDLLVSVNSNFCGADKHPIQVTGAFRGIFEGIAPDGQVISCRAMIYVSDSVTGFFLSCQTMIDLMVIDSSFPRIGRCCPSGLRSGSSDGDNSREIFAPVIGKVTDHNEAYCDCPQRSVVPDRPTELPFEPLPENIELMRTWLLNRYASSTFNVCPHRPLQQMAGPPVEIHLDEQAKPKVCGKAALIPLHWQKQVKEDLTRDEALGVIERVPYGVKPSWCHRMVITRKSDGAPRRTVDLSPLNRYCQRETFSGESPFVLARRVASWTWKTVSDAWNGYHSVPLRKSDRHLTTFITPFGRFRYTRAPQGFLSSGDGYNRRFAAVLSDFQRAERCVASRYTMTMTQKATGGVS